MESITHLSKAVYTGLSVEIGTASEVQFRRDTVDTSFDIYNCLNHKFNIDVLIAGSYREGFRFSSSDMDFMAWTFFMKVISDLSQISSIHFRQKRVFLMESDSVPPGYTKLRSLTFTPNRTLQNDDSFISCSVFRKSLVTLFNPGFKYLGTEVSEHGPRSFAIHNGFEMDIAGCMKCDYWPKTAKPWIRRCNEKGWPSDILVNQIVKAGCHVVPIGSCPENELEWRISFSVAEQKIIYSFNHSQFLCIIIKTALSLLRLSCIIGGVSEILYLGMYYYRNCRYQRSMMCLNKAMIRMCAPYSFFIFTDIQHYIRALGGLSLSSKYKRAIIRCIVLRYECSYISELVLEQKTDIKMENIFCDGELKISPLVMLLMLLILNYHKLDDSTKSDYYIQTLKTLLFSDDEEYESHFPKDLSWQILGICQQTCGYHEESLDSFLRSLKEKPSHRIRPATYLRMLLSIFLLKNK